MLYENYFLYIYSILYKILIYIGGNLWKIDFTAKNKYKNWYIKLLIEIYLLIIIYYNYAYIRNEMKLEK